MKNPAWSPDGQTLAFAGTDGGISDLYLLDLETNSVRQLTNDRYADLQPTWAPDGETIAFTTDRAETNFDVLNPSSQMDLGLIDVSSGEVTVREPFGDALHHNPQFSPDGQSLYFISDQDGFKDVYRMSLSNGERFRVTHLKTGVSGITALSPALSIASQSGDAMFSIYADDGYTGVRRPADAVQGTPLDAGTAQGPSGNGNTPTAERNGASPDTLRAAGTLPPYSPGDEGLVAANLSDPTTGLPSADYSVDDYDPSLSLEAVSQPQFGASVGGPLGGGVAGGIGFRFGDMLGHRSLTVAVQAQGSFRDIGGGVSYMNRRGQLNWGGSISHTPLIFSANTLANRDQLGRVVGLASIVQRAYITSLSGNASYPLSPTRRFEFSAGGTRYGFGTNVRTAGLFPDSTATVIEEQFGGRSPKYLATAGAAYVRDFTTNGLTGPLQGGRWRLEVSPTLGSQNFVTARADLRRYFYAKPFTLALQALHVGNYGATFNNEFGIGNEYIGYPYGQGFVRGYSVQSIANGIRENGGCTRVSNDPTASQCAEIDRLFGTRALTTRAELRVPLLGPDRISLIPFRYVPTTLAVFADAGITWTSDQGPDFSTFATTDSPEAVRRATNIPVVSTGVAARFNILGNFLLEAYYARPFQRRDTTWELGFRLSPGF
jgi:hypothetical protein